MHSYINLLPLIMLSLCLMILCLSTRESSDCAAHAQRLAEENSRLTKTLRRRSQAPEELYLEAERLASEAHTMQTAVQGATEHVDKQRLALAEVNHLRSWCPLPAGSA